MQFTKPSFLETKIEEKFFVLKSKNDKDKNKLLKKEIDLKEQKKSLQLKLEKKLLVE